MLDITGFINDINATIDGWDFENTITGSLIILCNIVVIFHFSKIFIVNISRGGESFSFDQLRTPIFYLIMITAWPYLFNFIDDASKGISDVVFTNSVDVYAENRKIYDQLNNDKISIEDKLKNADILNDLEQEKSSDLIPIEGFIESIKTLDERILIGILSFSYDLLSILDVLLYGIFYFVAKIWWKILSLGGAVAFTVSLLTGGWTVLINWAKTYLSVTLWVPVAATLMQMTNSLMLMTIKSAGQSRVNDYDIKGSINGMQLIETLMGIIEAFTLNLVVILVFLAIKIILLAKVPQIINGWISGGSSANGGFAAAFIPVNIAKNTAGTVAGAGAAVASGGSSAAAGAAAKGFKKK